MKAPKETDLVRACLDYLRVVRGWFAWRNHTAAAMMPSGRFMRFGEPGAPDILAILPASAPNAEGVVIPAGRLLAPEVKMPGGRLTPHQRAWLEAAGRAGALCCVVRSVQELRAALAAEGYPEA